MRIMLIIALIAARATIARAQPSAEDLFAQGQAAYDKADYATAIARWQASYDLSKENALLFNIAQARRLAGDCAGALAAYQQFAATDPDPASEQHKLAEDFARELTTTCVMPSPVDQQPQSQPKLVDGLNLDDRLTGHEHQDRGRGRTLRITGIATGTTGIAMIATGLVLGYHAQTLASEVTAACRTSCDWTTQKAKDASGRTDATIGRVLDGVGVAAVASGAVMYYLGVRRSDVVVTPK